MEKMSKYNFMLRSSKNGEKSWNEKTKKEKLDMVFVVVAIVGFTLGAIVNLKLLMKNKK
jgi:hypothetical protein